MSATDSTTNDPNAVLSASVDALLDVAEKLDQEKETLQGKISANRTMLRGFVTQGIATAEQIKEIEEFYPKRAENGSAKDKTTEPAKPDPTVAKSDPAKPSGQPAATK